ncbi:hypothetical protein AVEN_59713-1 [Araneus ventricosus]|uniref:Uncharacterized protein n=1 Tax=Araneus ventricosus TaxID=182803 RepID=A0A4Y2BQH2_ARAVE|nr:hypothetical protein AVEN_59713-1 [Araneus ventricosus]
MTEMNCLSPRQGLDWIFLKKVQKILTTTNFLLDKAGQEGLCILIGYLKVRQSTNIITLVSLPLYMNGYVENDLIYRKTNRGFFSRTMSQPASHCLTRRFWASTGSSS